MPRVRAINSFELNGRKWPRGRILRVTQERAAELIATGDFVLHLGTSEDEEAIKKFMTSEENRYENHFEEE